MPTLTLARHATLLLRLGDEVVLVDPMLNDAGAADPVAGTAPPERNPLVPLPAPAEHWVEPATAVLVTHLHNDHFDDAARRAIPKDLPVFCQPPDEERLRGDGFSELTAIEDTAELPGGLRVTRVPARHTLGEHEEALGPGSGYVIEGGGSTVYVAGDCVWCEELAQTLDRFAPDVVVVNGGAARFLTGLPITQTAEDVIAVARHAPEAHVVVVHLEAINHCPMRRDELRRHLVAAGVADRVSIPDDGEDVPLGERSG